MERSNRQIAEYEKLPAEGEETLASARITRNSAGLSPGREFPRLMYHATNAPKTISSAQEEAALGQEWSRVYIHQDYPKVKYHWNGKTVTVKNADEEAALGGGWANTPAAFAPYKGARPARLEEQNPVKWVDEWSAPGLSAEHRKKIKAQLLRADGAFERSPDPDSAALASMRQAFDGIARVLFEAGILTEDLLRKDIPQLVWDCAISGGWWRLASETRQDIFPEQIGRYWVWRDDSRDWKGLFRAEAGQWEATLLEAPLREGPADATSEPAATRDKIIGGDSPKNKNNTDEPKFPERAAWLKGRLGERGWNKHDVSRQGGPDHKTVQKILDGRRVREDVLEPLATALSKAPSAKKLPPVSLLDIPQS